MAERKGEELTGLCGGEECGSVEDGGSVGVRLSETRKAWNATVGLRCQAGCEGDARGYAPYLSMERGIEGPSPRCDSLYWCPAALERSRTAALLRLTAVRLWESKGLRRIVPWLSV